MSKNFFTEVKAQYDRNISTMRAQESKIQAFATASSGIIALLVTVGSIFKESISISNQFVELVIISFIFLIICTIVGFYGVIRTKYRIPIKAKPFLKLSNEDELDEIVTKYETMNDVDFSKRFSAIYLDCLASLENIIQKRLWIISAQVILFTIGNIILGIFLYLVLNAKTT